MRTLQIRVKPNARVSELQEMEDGTWVARLKARPVDGQANKELIALLAKHFKLPKAQVEIRTGSTGRTKLVQLDG